MDILASFEPPENDKPDKPASIVTTSLQELDLEKELLEQFHRAKRMLDEADNVESTINQKAAGLNAISTILNSIIKMQTQLYNAERVKLLELTLLDVLKEFPAISTAFMLVYTEKLLKFEEIDV